MKRYLYFLLSIFFMIFTINCFSQDTTVVQTFTWDSTARSAYFDFPDDPTKTYEKVLMIYNMRCHDAAVGNGSVGCREWDYSCNTFLYVPEKQDSSLAFQYDYDVSQHSDDYFAYTNDTHYTYYAFDKIQTTIKNTSSEYDFTVGETIEGTKLMKGQPGKMFMLYSRQELSDAGFTPGEINGMSLNFQDATSLNSVRIRISEVEDTVLSPHFYPLNPMTEVFFNDVNLEEGSNRFQFHSPVEWNGTSNILIEFSYDQITGPDPKIMGNSHQNSDTVFLVASNPSLSALEFGGSWGIELDPKIFDDIENEITISFWTFGRPQSLPNRNTTIMEGVDENGNRTINIHLPWSNSGVYWDCGNTGGSYDRINKTAIPLEFEGDWNHWTFTKNIATGSMKIYFNGQLWHSGTSKTKSIDVHNFRLGSSVSHSLGYYGMIDEISFWNKELDQETIQTIMSGAFSLAEPWVEPMLAYYDFEEGQGNTIADRSVNGYDAGFEGGPEWRKLSGRQVHMHHEAKTLRPGITLFRGNYNIDQEPTRVLDTVITPKNSVIQYAVINSKLVALDTFFIWEANDSWIYDAFGNELESFYVEPEDFLLFEELAYFTFRNSKIELLSLVTPYGNGLDLGPEGKTFTFDVTDFLPILKGNRRLSIEMGGQNQEELDIKFLFIEGTPTRDVIDISNIWPFARGYYRPILDDKIFETRKIQIPQGISQAKIRSSVTGHGQNGEFVARDHRISLNGQEKVFNYKVWKECAYNPIYPQGGTWIYDRAGWCPGMETDLHEFDITPYITTGESVDIDYAVVGPHMDQANYLVSNQIVYYGNPNFILDAALESIVRPNQDAVEFGRFNPNCTDPAVIIKNNGTTNLTSLNIIYGIDGISEKSFTWTGNLAFLETTEVTLPVDFLGFYGNQEVAKFYARIENPNGGQDEYENNNALQSYYSMPDVYEGYERWLLRVRTNNRAEENSYRLVDQAGNVVLSRQNLSDNTTYDDEMDLPPGCYNFEILDLGHDGLSFWNNPAAGSGWVSIRRVVNENISFEKIKFEADFGAEFNYDFIIDESVGISENQEFKRVSMFPNPASEELTFELEGLSGKRINIQVFDINGQLLTDEHLNLYEGKTEQKIKIDHLVAGHYLIKLFSEKGMWVKSFIKI